MNSKEVTIFTLRALSAVALAAGQAAVAASLTVLANAIQAGLNVDAHLAGVAEKLKSGTITDADWQDVADRITADSDRLQNS